MNSQIGNQLMALLAFLAALSVATERITEVIKGLPFISSWLSSDKKGPAEDLRKAVIHVIAIVMGAFLAYQAHDQLPGSLSAHMNGFTMYLLFGAIAAGGSGIWNSILDIMREANKQRQLLTNQLRG
jgi:hypothetical protein